MSETGIQQQNCQVGNSTFLEQNSQVQGKLMVSLPGQSQHVGQHHVSLSVATACQVGRHLGVHTAAAAAVAEVLRTHRARVLRRGLPVGQLHLAAVRHHRLLLLLLPAAAHAAAPAALVAGGAAHQVALHVAEWLEWRVALVVEAGFGFINRLLCDFVQIIF